ncbi:MAG TPA: DUF2269 family protein [Acidimicrobiia bacterium]|nr:DUF2269 family protein [Acidimicrobiia bacterium]
MLVIADTNSGAYKFVLVLHILSAIVGFGAVLLNGIYGQQARARRGPEGLAITQANFLVSRIAQYFIYAVFVFGVLLVVLSDKAWSFSDNWITAAIVLYVLGIGLSHGLLMPSVRRIIALQEELVAMGPPPTGAPAGQPPPQVVELEERGRRVGIVSTVLQVDLVVILMLMVWGPRF